MEPGDGLGGGRPMGRDVEAPLGRDLLAAFRYERHLVGLHAAGDGDHLRENRPLEIELHLHRPAEHVEIAVLDVAPVLTEVDGDRIGPAELCKRRRPDRVGFDGAARLSERGDMIDVDAERGHETSGCAVARLKAIHEDSKKSGRPRGNGTGRFWT